MFVPQVTNIVCYTRGQTLQYTLTYRKQTNITQLGGEEGAMFIPVAVPGQRNFDFV